jgi:TRAP-type C4-dicarboxylate transport system substrate-binding protein
MKKTCDIAIALLVAALFLSGLAVLGKGDVYAKETVLRLVIPSPNDPRDPLSAQAQEVAEKFNARAKGQYRIEVHAGGALVKIPEYFDAIRTGAVEMGCVNWDIFAFLDPRLGVSALPFLVDTLRGATYMAKELLPLYDAILQEKFNAKALSMFSTDGVCLVSKRPLNTSEDLKGLLIAAPSPNDAAMFKGLGAAPVAIVWTDLYEGLQKKIVDASAMTSHGAIAMSLMDVCGHMILFYGSAIYNGYSINLDVWKKMPKGIQEILQEEMDAVTKRNESRWIKLAMEDVKFLAEKGKNVYALPKAERKKWADMLAGYRNKQLSSFGEVGIKAKQIADEANSRYPYTGRLPE